MDTRREHGQYWPGTRTDASGETPSGTDNGKVDRVDLGTLPADATASEMRTAIRNIQNAMRPLATAIAAALCGFAMAQTAAWDSLRGGVHVVTNEQDSAAMEAIATATNALHTSLAHTISAASTALQPAATNGIPESIAGHETRIGALEESAADRPDMSLYALRAEVPQAVDLAPYATTTDVVNRISAAASATALQIETLSRNTASAIAASTNGLPERIASSTNALHTSLASTISAASTALQPAATNGLPERIASSTNALQTSLAPTISAAATALQPTATNNIPETLATHAGELARLSQALAANTESNTAYRLMSPGGDIYQDATGAVWRVAYSTNLSPWHVSLVAYTNGTNTATNEIPGVATWNISGPVDVGEGHWEWYLHIPAGGNVYAEGQTLGQEGQGINFYIGAGEVQSADFERTNIVTRYWIPADRVVYESAVPTIVTNEVAGGGWTDDWTVTPSNEVIKWTEEGWVPYYLGFEAEGHPKGNSESTHLEWNSAQGESLVNIVADRIPRTVNALGLARMSDLPPLTNGLATAGGLTTNDVQAIVTNETEAMYYTWMANGKTFTVYDVELPAPDEEPMVRFKYGNGQQVADWPQPLECAIDGNDWVVFYKTTSVDTWEVTLMEDGSFVQPDTFTTNTITRNSLGLVRLDDLPPLTNGLATAASVSAANSRAASAQSAANAASNTAASVAATVTAWETFWDGDNVRVTVTNYDSAVNLPSLYIEYKMENTDDYRTVWDERTRWQTNEVEMAELRSAIEEKADRAWGYYDSHTGDYAPDGYTWLSSPRIAIAGGLAYQRTLTTDGAIWVLTSNGMVAQTGGNTENGFFRIKDDEGNVTFEIVRGNKRTVGATAAGITVESSGGNHTVTVPYNVVSAEHPTLYGTANLSSGEWTELTGATWLGQSGAWTGVVTTASATYFLKAEYETGGETYIRNAAPVSVDGGLYATNTASGGYVKIRPKWNGSTITWEVVP